MKEREMIECDVAIVGGGVTGLYCAWELQKRYRGRRVVRLFESSARLGGRVETVLMGNNHEFKAEFGPMRYEAVGQVKLMKLLGKLDLQTSKFPAYQSKLVEYPKYDITDAEEKRWPNPLDLLLMGILKLLGKYRDGMTKKQMLGAVEEYEEKDYPGLRQNARQGGKRDGQLLHERGLWNALADVLSHQAVLKIRDTGNFYHVIHESPNAIEWIIFWLRAFHPDDYLVGIKGGSSKLTDALEKKLDPRIIRKECRLVAFRDQSDVVRLAFEHRGRSVSVDAQHVILALPKRPLESLAPSLPLKVRADLDAVRGIPLLKCFFVVTKPWWNEDTRPHTNAGHMPVREVHYYREHVLQLDKGLRDQLPKPGKPTEVPRTVRAAFKKAGVKLPERASVMRKPNHPNAPGWWISERQHQTEHLYFIADEDLSVFDRRGKGMVLAYTDRPATEYWNRYVEKRDQHDRAEMRGSTALKRRFFKYLAEELAAELDRTEGELPGHLRLFEGLTTAEDIEAALVEQVEDWGIRDWELGSYGGAFHIWRPGVKSWEVMDRLKAFGKGGRLHIAGEAFSDYQGFIEGCLNTAELVLDELPKQPAETTG